ncbi:hypothetical protein FC90_GL000612 [Latilactobacillus graminis DSM 20719]|uniref:Uncharacterized protein n=1 Tax=Latilactobacillus graminis DSM 20719 TaxID=1423752 RepID=A0AA89I389_9LACO|nr:hypothetical protein FC90_GL000612 [Latilactobacillus graminis DSM 20719]
MLIHFDVGTWLNKSRTVVTKRYGALSTDIMRLLVFLSFLADKKTFLFVKNVVEGFFLKT